MIEKLVPVGGGGGGGAGGGTTATGGAAVRPSQPEASAITAKATLINKCFFVIAITPL